ncbi:MAG: MCE family protein [Actinobacteria bacterium]|nr:MCE family protein [Actinomycetota bacterium]
MKSFTERNPIILGLLLVAFVVAGTGAALLLNGGFFKSRYTVTALFTDSAGLRRGDRIRVAGVPAGEVGGLRLRGDRVAVKLQIDKGVDLPRDSRAEIMVATLLGTKYVSLVPGRDWSRLLRKGSVITDTVTPVEVLDLQNTGVRLLDKSDGRAFNDLLARIADVTAGKAGDVKEILRGLDRLSVTIDNRQTQARRLIDSARRLTATLASRDGDLARIIDRLDLVVRSLAERRQELVTLLQSTSRAARQVADLVKTNRPRLDAVLNEVDLDLQVIGRHQMDLAQSVSLLSVAIEGFSSIGYSGPDEVPTPWANIFTQLIGPLGPDALFGSCGAVDKALDLSLGPDPAGACANRTGPLPGAASSATGNASGPPAPASAAGGSTAAPAGAQPASGPLDQLYAPFLGAGR